jgi:hypothetical protein
VKKKSSLTALCLLCCAGSAAAQSLQPQFYLWGPPENPQGPIMNWTDRRFSPSIHVLVGQGNDGTPEGVALNVAARFQFFANNNWIDPARINIILQDFGHWVNGQQMTTSFFHMAADSTGGAHA